MYSENSGSCRFHRKWVEDIIDEIILSHFALSFDYWETNFQLVKAIHQFQSAASVPWESERVVDIIFQYLMKWQRIGLKNAALDEWVARFQADKLQAGRDYWQEMYRGMSDAFEQGIKEPAHAEHGFIEKPKL
jgi:glyceraldehyde-3-phosphate dehydrogenase (ferredoxin)